jgi:hypothetical protein
MQIAMLFISIGIALLGGAFSGFIASRLGRTIEHIFNDEENWMHCTYDIQPNEEEVADDNASALHTARVKPSEPDEDKAEENIN